ncbi:hypothetical protein O181_059622 [Austropuccinia psidii MF-1]|uniref:Integrase catalytic domain-containing protein n=1 Tax=Austropuccinia psidii MF-1 TaxID=1389203 RepID=A0A9Q3EH13_9BASI|nr:hypothetical protein [Austropuccinia psidii MF-1]
MVTGQESPYKCSQQEKIDPDRKRIAYTIVSLNCDVKIASQFDNKCNLNLTILWTFLEEFYLPKTVPNQAAYLSRIFSTRLSKGNLTQGIEKIQELTHNQCSLIDDQAIKPSILLDSIVALWDRNSIVLDSGASNGIFNDEKNFISFIPKEEEVILADGSSIKYLGSGTIHIELSHFFLRIDNCLLIPQLAINLLRMNTFIVANYSVTKGISTESFVVTGKDNKVIIDGSFESGNFIIHQNKIHAFKFSLSTPSTTVLHQSSGHPSLEYFKKMYPGKNISSFDCTTCSLSKMTKMPFKGTFPQPNCKLEAIHMDLWGPISPESISGKKYFLQIPDGFSHFVWIFFLTNKSECKDYIKNLISRVKQQPNSKLANLILDNGSEFKNTDLQNFFKSKGINNLTLTPYTP